MTLIEALRQATTLLRHQDMRDAYFEAEAILAHILQTSRAYLYSHPEQRLTQKERNSFQKLVERRLSQEPLAYIRKNQEFYNIQFYIDHRVLIPRPETELLVEEALEVASNYARKVNPVLIADIGTGCGAIAISIALNLPQARIYASDVSAGALEVARLNCHQHQVNSQLILLQGNLLEPLPEPVHLIVANLPYVKNTEIEMLSPEVKDFEPRLALDGGQDGLTRIHQLLEQLDGKLLPDGCLLLEIGQGQTVPVTSWINRHFPEAKIELLPDLNAIDRVVKVIF